MLLVGCGAQISPTSALPTEEMPAPTTQLPSLVAPAPQPPAVTDAPVVEQAPPPFSETVPANTGLIPPEALKNAAYSGIFEDHPIALTDGLAHYDDGGSQLPYVSLVDHRIPAGDLNGDGAEDAVVLLVDNTSGSGDFVYLAPVLNVLTKPTPLQAFLIGDRIPVKSLVIQGGQVIAELIAPGPGDPACCPSWNVRKIYSLENNRLVERSSQELGKVSLDDLNGTSWRLVDLDQGQEPLLPETEITLGFDDGQVSGSAGCNNYNSVVSGDANLPQTLVVGPIATTKKLCPQPLSNQETTFLTRLESVVAWRYDFGYLSLIYKIADNVFGELSFAPQAP
jgi:heat shock protein HslJ